MDAEAQRQLELLEKKKRRLERNRASARQCRKRKKEKKLQLRQQLAHLEADNLQLRLKLQVGPHTQDNLDQSAIITSKLDEMINEGGSEAEIEKKIQELKERFSDYGRDRRSTLDFHIAQLRRCLQPTQTTRAILFLMSLAPQFPEITYGTALPEAGNELMTVWYNLLQELKPDQAQREVMVNFAKHKENEHNDSDPFQDIHNTTDSCNRILDRIVEIVCNKNDSLDSEMSNLQSILSARQTAKFILWIDRNPACMQMLEALWPHIASTSNSSSNNDSNADELAGASGVLSSSFSSQPSSYHYASASPFPKGFDAAYQDGDGDDSDDDSDESD